MRQGGPSQLSRRIEVANGSEGGGGGTDAAIMAVVAPSRPQGDSSPPRSPEPRLGRQEPPVAEGDAWSSTWFSRVVVGGLLVTDLTALLIGIGRYGHLTVNTFLLAGLAVWLLAVGDHYRLRFHLSILDDLPGVVGRVVFALSLGAAYREFVSGHNVFTADRFKVLIAVASLVVIGRAVAYGASRWARRRGCGRRTALVIADEPTAQALERAVDVVPEAGLTLGRRLGSGDQRGDVDLGRHDLVLADAGTVSRTEQPGLLQRCEAAGCELYILAPGLSGHQARHRLDHVGWIPLLPVRPAIRSTTWPLKRLLDIVLGGILLVGAAPVVAVCAAVLRAENGPGVLFRQERVGLNGRRFQLLKLRTIVPVSTAESESTWHPGTESMTRFARFLRTSSLDELPQLWNVISGDMSLVGPRPERPHFAERFSASIPDYDDRHRVPAGLTGLAQIHGLRGDTSISERARLDNAYIDSWSLLQDVKILVRTLGAVASRRGRGS